MKIQLKKLTLHYFKGAIDQVVDFSERTAISGRNASGKTRIFDAFTWLLFGKDSDDKKDFNIKCLDIYNEPLHRKDTSVTGVLSIDGHNMTLERIYKEKWVKRNGDITAEFKGHETAFFVNGVPVQAKDYQQTVDSILPENLFKQITNPLFFNSMKWTERRAMLFEIAGNVSDSDVIKSNPELKEFLDQLSGKTIDNFKKELAAKKKLLKESIADIPARIDEVQRAILPDPDYNAVNTEITSLNERIKTIDALMLSEAEKANAANRENQRKQDRVYELEKKIRELQFNELSKYEESTHELKTRKTRLGSDISQLQADISSLKARIENTKGQNSALGAENNGLRNQWSQVNASSLAFDDNEFICPACKRPFETDDIEAKRTAMQENFNNDKARRLDDITRRGKENAAVIEQNKEKISEYTAKITEYNASIDAKTKELNTIIIPEVPANDSIMTDEIKTLQGELDITRGLLNKPVAADNSQLIAEKSEIGKKLDELKSQLAIREQNEKIRTRKEELIESEKSLAQQIADIEKVEYQADSFIRAKIEMIESKVNSMFSLVKFKMFNTLINGGSEETCETLINGVPYQDANHAAKINAGIDIIRVLSKHYDVYAPIFVDNAEALNEVIDTDSQMIKMYVTSDRELQIFNN